MKLEAERYLIGDMDLVLCHRDWSF